MTPVIDVMIQGVHKRFSVDTGSSVTLVQSGTSKAPFCRTALKPQGVTSKELHVLVTQVIEFTIGNRTFGHEFTVSDLTTPTDRLLRNEFLLEHEAVISYNYQDLYLNGYKIKFYNLYQFNQQ
jgi:hypothetical protein